MSKITKQQLQSYLWESANILRGKIEKLKIVEYRYIKVLASRHRGNPPPHFTLPNKTWG